MQEGIETSGISHHADHLLFVGNDLMQEGIETWIFTDHSVVVFTGVGNDLMQEGIETRDCRTLG
jgi:hypothetical protein